MSQPIYDIVIPIFRHRWNTQAVLEGLSLHYQPRRIHLITPQSEVPGLKAAVPTWQSVPIRIHGEETFFPDAQLSKATLGQLLDLSASLYTPGWFYQQLLKLGAYEGLPDLSEWYLVWDSDLLPVQTWPHLDLEAESVRYPFALLQHRDWGNPDIVGRWEKWIQSVLAVPPLTDPVGTFVPHHMWFKQEHLKSFARRVQAYYQSDAHWLRLMMQSANEFGTFSEYWAYTSWVAAQSPDDLTYYPYESYGHTTERFFDDGTGRFSVALRAHQGVTADDPSGAFSPNYAEVMAFIQSAYPADALPSSLAFESSPRHLKKGKENMHIEELRSPWHHLQEE